MIDASEHCRRCYKLIDLMAVLLNPAYTWGPGARKAYVVLWPIAILMRAICFVVLAATIIVAAQLCTAWVYFMGVWKGEEIKW